MGDDEVVEEGRVLFPDFVLLKPFSRRQYGTVRRGNTTGAYLVDGLVDLRSFSGSGGHPSEHERRTKAVKRKSRDSVSCLYAFITKFSMSSSEISPNKRVAEEVPEVVEAKK